LPSRQDCIREVPVLIIPTDDPLAIAAVRAIREGDVEALQQLLTDHPELADAALGSKDSSTAMTRSLLHVATDWPGHFPRGVETVNALVAAGADVNARFTGPHTETPLHWAASSDDVDVIDALLDAGADIEASGAVIAGGTPMADATAFAQWNAAQRLLQRGAKTNLWEASALGLLDRVEGFFAGDELPASDQVTGAFWGACHGGHRDVAEYLRGKGADINWVGWDQLTPLDAAARSGATDVVDWLRSVGGSAATP
jgi:ankyrin repeat protein